MQSSIPCNFDKTVSVPSRRNGQILVVDAVLEIPVHIVEVVRFLILRTLTVSPDGAHNRVLTDLDTLLVRAMSKIISSERFVG